MLIDGKIPCSGVLVYLKAIVRTIPVIESANWAIRAPSRHTFSTHQKCVRYITIYNFFNNQDRTAKLHIVGINGL